METRQDRANNKLLTLISYTDVENYWYWKAILLSFPITKRGRLAYILRNPSRKESMGIAVDHLKSVASIIGIPNTYIKDLCERQQNYRKDKCGIMPLIRTTNLLLKATYHAILQTGEG